MRRAVPIVLVLACILGVFAATRGGDPVLRVPSRPAPADNPPTRSRIDTAREPGTPAPAAGGVECDAGLLRALRAALGRDDAPAAQDAAARLRGQLRTDPESWRAATALLTDASLDERLRAVLALVLGTIDTPETDATLRHALLGAHGEFARACVLALGATREPPEDDEVFGLGDRPWGEEGPGGIGITVRRIVTDDATRQVLTAALREGETELRRAAAVALRHTLDDADVRTAFTRALGGEQEDAALAEVAEALAGRARGAPEAERDAFLRTLVDRAAEPDMDGTRFRVIDDLARVPLPRDVVARLREIALGSGGFAVRSFGLDALVAGAAAGDRNTIETARDVLVRTLESDVDPALRDAAAHRLRAVPPDARAQSALLRAACDDAAWNVRYSAIESLARFGGAHRDAAVAAARADDDERVRALAAELNPASRSR